MHDGIERISLLFFEIALNYSLSSVRCLSDQKRKWNFLGSVLTFDFLTMVQWGLMSSICSPAWNFLLQMFQRICVCTHACVYVCVERMVMEGWYMSMWCEDGDGYMDYTDVEYWVKRINSCSHGSFCRHSQLTKETYIHTCCLLLNNLPTHK